MPSPRALVGMRIAAETRLSEDLHALAEVMDMPADEVPVLLTPRVPNNDPTFKHVRFMEGVCSIVERFLQHAGVDMAARRAQAEEDAMADHSRPEFNLSGGPNIQTPVGDPRMTGVGQGLVDPESLTVVGVTPGMLEGDDGEVREALEDVDAAHLAVLKDWEERRVGGPRTSVMEIIREREAEIATEAKITDVPEEHQEVIDQQQADAREAAEAQAAANADKPVDPPEGTALMQPNRQIAPERPPAAVRQRRTQVGPKRRR